VVGVVEIVDAPALVDDLQRAAGLIRGAHLGIRVRRALYPARQAGGGQLDAEHRRKQRVDVGGVAPAAIGAQQAGPGGGAVEAGDDLAKRAEQGQAVVRGGVQPFEAAARRLAAVGGR